jgi:hypothetical protein
MRACARPSVIRVCPGACDRGYFRGEGREAGEVGRVAGGSAPGKTLAKTCSYWFIFLLFDWFFNVK